MAVKNEKDLNARLRGYWLKAVAAIELRNFNYAIELLQNLLRQEPEFLTGRRMLRRAEITRAKGEKKGLFKISAAPLAVLRAQRELRKNPRKTMELIEQVLASSPYNRQANLLLKEAAVSSGYPEIAIFALETLLENEPEDLRILHQLGQLCYHSEQNDKAVEVYHRIAEIDPLDLEAIRLGKDASARASMKEAGWIEAQSYRDLIKDKSVAVSLEQQNLIQLNGESLEQQIRELFGQHEADPHQVGLAKRLGALHDQKDDLEGALAWYQYALDLTNKSDSGLVGKIAELKIRQLDRQIRDAERYLAEGSTEDPGSAVRRDQLATMKKQRSTILIEEARKQIERNPTDLQLRYELGQRLTNAGEYREAIPELQRARNHPNARHKAMNLLGCCYRELGMLDLAARQLDEAARDLIATNATRKEILYNLGLIYEEMGDTAQSIDAMKKIYESDHGYRDVAHRVESSYRSTTKGIQNRQRE